MGEEQNIYKDAVTKATAAVSEMDETLKVEAFKIVLQNILNGSAPVAQGAQVQQPAAGQPVTNTTADDSWQGKIAKKLSITTSDVEKIYHFDDDTLSLIIDHKKMPSTTAQKAAHVAALISAGRQAIGLDEKATAFNVINEVCKYYGCYDASNAAKYIKSLGKQFAFTGKGKTQALGLTVPAYAIASKIAESYVGAGDE